MKQWVFFAKPIRSVTTLHEFAVVQAGNDIPVSGRH